MKNRVLFSSKDKSVVCCIFGTLTVNKQWTFLVSPVNRVNMYAGMKKLAILVMHTRTVWSDPVNRPVSARSGKCTIQMVTNEKTEKS